MKASIYIPEELYREVQEYLKIYPQKNLSGLIREALEERLKPKTSRLLELAGFASLSVKSARSQDEILEDERERPEDEPIKNGLDK